MAFIGRTARATAVDKTLRHRVLCLQSLLRRKYLVLSPPLGYLSKLAAIACLAIAPVMRLATSSAHMQPQCSPANLWLEESMIWCRELVLMASNGHGLDHYTPVC